MKRFTAGAAAVLFSVTAISWTAGAVTGLTGAREAFRRECSRCHEPERALRRSKDEQAWKKTVERMSRYAQSRYKKPIPEEVRTAAEG